MRKLVRPETPAILREHGDHWNEQWKRRKTENPAAKFAWYRHENRSVRDWILPDLSRMTNEHCSFCDRYTVEPESVEHFRPKSDHRFLHLAYSWENLFFCCGQCQTHKLEQWDDDLISPDASDYSFSRYFVFDWTTGAMSPNPTASPSDQTRAETTIRIYGLDTVERRRFRLMELRKWERTNATSVDDFAYRDFIAPPDNNVVA